MEEMRYDARSDWLIVEHYSSVMPTGRLKAFASKAKCHIKYQTYTLPFWSPYHLVNTARRCYEIINSKQFRTTPVFIVIQYYTYLVVNAANFVHEMPIVRKLANRFK